MRKVEPVEKKPVAKKGIPAKDLRPNVQVGGTIPAWVDDRIKAVAVQKFIGKYSMALSAELQRLYQMEDEATGKSKPTKY